MGVERMFTSSCGTGPARKPHGFTILSNRTLVALTLQWHPGFDGGHPPQTFTLQYRASTEVTLRTWRDMFSYTTDGVTRYQATVSGLRAHTVYVFSLYAENSRPPVQSPKRSKTVTLIGSTIEEYADVVTSYVSRCEICTETKTVALYDIDKGGGQERQV
ncbi:hypothetical protein NP493_674g01000 [Ridgeia piscesae]|uniref:Fibronectin type-III domain-containing protein n=1 Tax=Ridgeia piscesae TaxID=27915 RepID=A0AAD9KRL6_RIDPI|nr:hypothetical protein NP493_674g01000 [Ridgeia piscesae]